MAASFSSKSEAFPGAYASPRAANPSHNPGIDSTAIDDAQDAIHDVAFDPNGKDIKTTLLSLFI
jgi:hypothetical protein